MQIGEQTEICSKVFHSFRLERDVLSQKGEVGGGGCLYVSRTNWKIASQGLENRTFFRF